MNNYVVYHLHTEDSLLDSCTNYKLYVNKAVELGQKAICFTEHGNIFRWTEKKAYVNSKGLKYLHGCEVYLTEYLLPRVRDNYHTILIAKNYDGVKELNTLIGMATDKSHMYYKPRISFDEFYNISDNIIKISACLASPLSKYPTIIQELKNKIKQNEYRDDEELSWLKNKLLSSIKTYKKLLETYDYYEIQPHIKSLDQIKYNKMLYELSKRYGKPLIAATDTHSLDNYKAQCRTIIQKAKKIEFAEEDTFDLTYKSYDELVQMFEKQNSLPMDVVLQAIENTNIMADSVDDFELDTSIKYPKLYDNEETVLKQRIIDKLKYKLEHGIINKNNLPKYIANIAEEMRVFKKINMVGFMLFMSELVTWCWDNGIPIGFCRGSVGGSTIAYITDIIDVDPIKWNTIFSRFANEDREEVGDIDIDISPDQRDLVYQHIIEQFGLDKTAYILAQGTVSDKGTIDEIGRALSIPLNTVAEIKERYSAIKNEIDSLNEQKKEALERNDENLINGIDKRLEKLNDNMSVLKTQDYPELFYYFDGINGTVISQGMHPAGIIVSPITLPDNYGCFWNNDGKRITYINMEEIHDYTGLVKYDLLGLKSLQVLRKTCEYIGIPYPKSHEINWEDEAVWNDIIVNPAGIFQFEGSYAHEMLKQFKPHKINDMSIVNAALRPSGASYRNRLLAREENKNPSPIIDDLLKENNGYLIFQEDVIKFLQQICGMSGSEADNLRRAIGRKQVDRLQKALPSILDGYCKMSPQPREVAEQEVKAFLKIIEDASRYMFGFNHSTGYSMIGYLCGYLRYYYPEEFIAAYLNCANNSDDIVFGTDLAKVKNVKINTIKFGKSRADYTVDKPNNSVYKGIQSIKYCNAQIAEELYELAQNNTYTDFIDLLIDLNEKTSINSRQLEILTILNFFSDFGENKYLLNIIKLFDKLNGVKQIKKSKMEELGVNEFIMQKFSEKETEKIYKGIDWIGILKELSKKIEHETIDLISQMKYEKEFLEYIDYVNPDANKDYYIIVDFVQYKDASKPRFVARRICDGEEITARIKQSKIFKSSPFGLWSALEIRAFDEEFKKKPDQNGKWVVTDETEYILNEYEVIKNYECN